MPNADKRKKQPLAVRLAVFRYCAAWRYRIAAWRWRLGIKGGDDMTNALRPARPVPPGRIIEREMQARGWDAGDLCSHTTLSLTCIAGLLEANTRIHPYIADNLAAAFGTSAELWLSLQRQYDEALVAEERKP